MGHTTQLTHGGQMAIVFRLPSWFLAVPGFTFFDSDGDMVRVIGWGAWRKPEIPSDPSPVTIKVSGAGEADGVYVKVDVDISFKPAGLIAAYFYKGEWCMFDLAEQTPEWWAKACPDPDKL